MYEYLGNDQSCHVDSESLYTTVETPSLSQTSLTIHILLILFLCIFCCPSIVLNNITSLSVLFFGCSV